MRCEGVVVLDGTAPEVVAYLVDAAVVGSGVHLDGDSDGWQIGVGYADPPAVRCV